MSTVEENKQARERAEEFAKFIGVETTRFWETLANIAADKCGRGVAILPKHVIEGNAADRMTDNEAAEFERSSVPFGKYAGQPIGDVPCSYWTYVTESEFNRNLIRYLRSKTFQQRREQ